MQLHNGKLKSYKEVCMYVQVCVHMLRVWAAFKASAGIIRFIHKLRRSRSDRQSPRPPCSQHQSLTLDSLWGHGRPAASSTYSQLSLHAAVWRFALEEGNRAPKKQWEENKRGVHLIRPPTLQPCSIVFCSHRCHCSTLFVRIIQGLKTREAVNTRNCTVPCFKREVKAYRFY